MKRFLSVSFVLLSMVSVLLSGCGSENSTTSPASGVAKIEGQLVADAGLNFTTRVLRSTRAAEDVSRPVYPVSGATVELIRDGAVIATTTTDEYGRFSFRDLAAGEYEVRVISGGEAVAHYRTGVAPDQSLTVYGRVVDGDCLWDGENSPRWDDMAQGSHWGGGFQGNAPGRGYWHDGQQWCDPQGTPQGTGPHGPGTPQGTGPHGTGTPQGTGPHGPGGPHRS